MFTTKFNGSDVRKIFTPVTRLDSMTLPAELTMGVIGLYGLYFAAVSFNQARRKKRSLQGNSIITGILISHLNT